MIKDGDEYDLKEIIKSYMRKGENISMIHNNDGI